MSRGSGRSFCDFLEALVAGSDSCSGARWFGEIGWLGGLCVGLVASFSVVASAKHYV